MFRETITEDGEEGWVFLEGADRWASIIYRPAEQCLHKSTMCESCWEAWYDEYNILLASRTDPRDTRNFDDMAIEARVLLDIPESQL